MTTTQPTACQVPGCRFGATSHAHESKATAPMTTQHTDPLAALCADLFGQVNSAHSERVKMIAVLQSRILPLVEAAQAARLALWEANTGREARAAIQAALAALTAEPGKERP